MYRERFLLCYKFIEGLDTKKFIVGYKQGIFKAK